MQCTESKLGCHGCKPHRHGDYINSYQLTIDFIIIVTCSKSTFYVFQKSLHIGVYLIGRIKRVIQLASHKDPQPAIRRVFFVHSQGNYNFLQSKCVFGFCKCKFKRKPQSIIFKYLIAYNTSCVKMIGIGMCDIL